MHDFSFLSGELLKHGIVLTEEQKEQFGRYYDMLTEWNAKINLTSISGLRETEEKHFLDSLSPLFTGLIPRGAKLIDVGTGAGFPGIPLKIARPDLAVTLLDSLKKRISFIVEVVSSLGLDDVRSTADRAETFARDADNREAYDVCVSRAVAPLNVLCEYCLPFLSVGGVFISFKSSSYSEDLRNAQAAINVLGGNVEEVKSYFLPFAAIERNLIVIRKKSNSPDLYPRRNGIPAKRPIVK